MGHGSNSLLPVRLALIALLVGPGISRVFASDATPAQISAACEESASDLPTGVRAMKDALRFNDYVIIYRDGPVPTIDGVAIHSPLIRSSERRSVAVRDS